VTDLTGVARGVDGLANADAAEALGTAVQVVDFRFHFGQALDDRAELHAQ
jgi:hypothetical protein